MSGHLYHPYIPPSDIATIDPTATAAGNFLDPSFSTQRFDLSQRSRPQSDAFGGKEDVYSTFSLPEKLPTDLRDSFHSFIKSFPPMLKSLPFLHKSHSYTSIPDPFSISKSPTVSSGTEASSASRLLDSSASSLFSKDSNLFESADHIEEDVFERAEHTTIRTVIRPASRFKLLRFLAHPFSRTSIPSLRGGHPLGFKPLDGLIHKVPDPFEEDLDMRQQQWEAERQSAGAVEIYVVEQCETYQEESWRSLVQEMCYGNQPSFGTVSFVGDHPRAGPRMPL